MKSNGMKKYQSALYTARLGIVMVNFYFSGVGVYVSLCKDTCASVTM